jgi:hypothetical protein
MIATVPENHWPESFDGTLTIAYACMVLDFRAYLRSLRRALVVISHYRSDLPGWVMRDNPPCIRGLGLELPCTIEDVLSAYREKVKVLHPDRGGDRRKFLRLQEQFEQAMALLAND